MAAAPGGPRTRARSSRKSREGWRRIACRGFGQLHSRGTPRARSLKTASKSSRMRNCLPCIPKSSPNGSSNSSEELPPWKGKMSVYFCRLLIATLLPSLDLHTSWIQNMPGVLQEMLFPSCVPHPVQLGFGSFQYKWLKVWQIDGLGKQKIASIWDTPIKKEKRKDVSLWDSC